MGGLSVQNKHTIHLIVSNLLTTRFTCGFVFLSKKETKQ